MPYANGTPTGDEHAENARLFLDQALNQSSDGSHPDVTAALVGIGHALLAVLDELESGRQARP